MFPEKQKLRELFARRPKEKSYKYSSSDKRKTIQIATWKCSKDRMMECVNTYLIFGHTY